jgi:hypothetical protein
MNDKVVIVVQSAGAPQGSKRHLGNGVMIESSQRVKPFRQDVKFAAAETLNSLQLTLFHQTGTALLILVSRLTSISVDHKAISPVRAL